MTSSSKGNGKSAKGRASSRQKVEGFTEDERAAMKERVQEMRAAARRGSGADEEDAERTVLAKIAQMPEPDRTMGKRIHAIVRASAPNLTPRLWYGMPAYSKEDSVLCHFQPAHKFKTRYATFGFSDEANLDEGAMWPVAFALEKLTAEDEVRIAALVKRAVG